MGVRKTLVLGLFALSVCSCRHPFSVTAVSESEICQGKGHAHPEGIPYYLPKPLLVISKNFTYLEEAQVGLTEPAPIPNQFDKQEAYATLNASAGISTTAPGPAAPGKPAGAYGDTTPPKPDSCCCCPTQVLHSEGIPVAPDCTKKVAACATPFFT
jgi:hypothetical protein